MAKLGRPKKDNPMDYRVTVRLTEEVGLSHSETVKAALELYYKSLKKK